MAKIEDLVDEIADPLLRDRIAREVRDLKDTKRFGLVFEEHIPETVSLYGLPIRPGLVVQNRTTPDDLTEYQVLAVEDGKATLVPKGADEPEISVDVGDLLVVKRFHETIFPGLTPVGEVRRGPVDKPAHVVINGENFHALQVLTYSCAGRVDCIYIDPPYNTGDRSWKYNNRFVDDNDSYRHSKWLSFMDKRLRLAKALLKPDGVLVVTIDEHELHHLGVLLESDDLFASFRRQLVTIVINASGASSDGLSRVEEYAIYVCAPDREPALLHDDLLLGRKEPKPPSWESLLRRGSTWYRRTRPNLCYPVLIDPDTMRIVGAGEPHPDTDEDQFPTEIDGKLAAWPIRSDGRLGIWRVEGAKLEKLASEGYAYVSSEDKERGTWTVKYLMSGTLSAIVQGEIVVQGRGERGQVVLGIDEIPRKKAKTVWHRGSHTAGGLGGTQLLTALLGQRGMFDYPKSVYAVHDALAAFLADRPGALIVDFFAGSGTTLHATALLNAADDGNRRCVLVTNNEVADDEAQRLVAAGVFVGDQEYEAKGIFDAVTMPRCKGAITGQRPDGTKVPGRYLDDYLEDHPYANGFEENAVFLRMDYLDPDLVELGRQYNAIAPILWMTAGSVGLPEEWDAASPWSVPPGSTYGVLFDEEQINEFADVVRESSVTHVWIVTNSDSAFAEMRMALPDDLVVVRQLYADYLRNFTVNAPGILRR